MSSGEDRKVSCQDFLQVQNLIERCLQLYMSQKEVVNTLLVQERIEPDLTKLVWQKLEEENQEFFKAYHLKLSVKEQVMEFNRLLARQVELMHQTGPAGVASMTMSNGSQIPPMHQISAFYALENSGPALNPVTMHQPSTTNLPTVFANCESSVPSCMQTAVDMSAHAKGIDDSPNLLLAQSSNAGMIQGINGGLIKMEPGYVGSSPFIFGANGNVLESRSAIGDASVSSFGSSQHSTETLLDVDTSSFGFSGQIPRNFSLSDLTADFSNSFWSNCTSLGQKFCK